MAAQDPACSAHQHSPAAAPDPLLVARSESRVALEHREDGDSLFEEGSIELAGGMRGDSVGHPVPVVELSFQETRSGGSYEWHQDPVPRFVITLSGTLEFETKSGASFTIRPGDVLLAQDNTGTGHTWKLIGEDPWRRAYVVYERGAHLQFKPTTVGRSAAIASRCPVREWATAPAARQLIG
jgi:quercetin dioxygenase-like cupin family protein